MMSQPVKRRLESVEAVEVREGASFRTNVGTGSRGRAFPVKKFVVVDRFSRRRMLRADSVWEKELHAATAFSSLQLLRDVKRAILGVDRQRQRLELTAQRDADTAKQHQSANRKMVLCTVGIAITAFAQSHPMFFPLGVVIVLYLSRSPFIELRKDVMRGRLLTSHFLVAVIVVAMIGSGYLVLSAIAGLVMGLIIRLRLLAQEGAQNSLIEVFAGHPSHVWVERAGTELQVEFEAVRPGDIVVLHAGEVISVDGVVESGMANVDQQLLTGESRPVERGPGEKVFASTLLLTGNLRVRVETAGETTVAAKIGTLLNRTQAYKDRLQQRGQQFSERFVPMQLGLCGATWALLGIGPATAVLWAKLGTRMELYGPLSILSFLQVLSRRGILIKDGRVLECLHKVDTVVFDKTGTLTLEQPTVSGVYTLEDFDETTVLRYAAAAEHRQSHPVARAILQKAGAMNLKLPEFEDASYEVGFGIRVRLEGRLVHVGSARFVEREKIEIPGIVEDWQQNSEARGNSLVYVSVDGHLAGVLELEPTIRPEAEAAVRFLKQRDISVHVISGDHEAPTRRLCRRLGIENFSAETLPENKSELVREMQRQGRFVCFVGDGVNDAIALKSAEVSISLKGATTAATDTAQIIFIDGTLKSLTRLFQLTDEFEKSMRNNVWLSLAPGILCIAGVYVLGFGVVTTMSIYYFCSVFGLTHAVWPLVRYQQELRRPHLAKLADERKPD